MTHGQSEAALSSDESSSSCEEEEEEEDGVSTALCMDRPKLRCPLIRSPPSLWRRRRKCALAALQ
jgi:hypothetical protein